MNFTASELIYNTSNEPTASELIYNAYNESVCVGTCFPHL